MKNKVILKMVKNKKWMFLFILFPFLILIPLLLNSCSNTLPPVNTGKVTPVIQKISDISTPVSFEFNGLVKDHNTNTIKRTEAYVSGTAWVFDKLIDNNSDLRTYYLATNTHVIDFYSDFNINEESQIGKSYNYVSLRLPLDSFSYFTNNGNGNLENLLPNTILDKQSYDNIYKTKQLIQNDVIRNGFYTIDSNNFWTQSNNWLNFINRSKYISSNNENIVVNKKYDFSWKIHTWRDILLSNKQSGLQNNQYNFLKYNDIDLGIIELTFKKDSILPWFIQSWEQNYGITHKYPFSLQNTNIHEEVNVAGFPSKTREQLLAQQENDTNINTKSIYNYYFPALVWSSAIGESYIKNRTFPGYWNDLYKQLDPPLTPMNPDNRLLSTRITLGVPNLNIGHGSSGSCVMNPNGEIIGIYWGGWEQWEGNVFNDTKVFYGAVDLFKENNVMYNWKLFNQFKHLQTFLMTFNY